MTDSLQTYLEGALKRVERLQAVVVTDRDGVVLLKAGAESLPPKALEPAVYTAFATSSDQAGKLGLGKNSVITTTFDRLQLLQFNHAPLIVSLFADKTANTGLLLELGAEVGKVLHPVVSALQDSLSK